MKDLNDALVKLKKLTDEGAAVPTANTNWQNAKTTYTNALATRATALAAQADYQTSNTDLKASKTTSVLLQAQANATAAANAVTGMQFQIAYETGVLERAEAALKDPKAA